MNVQLKKKKKQKAPRVVVVPQASKKKKDKTQSAELTRLGYALRALGGMGGAAAGALVGQAGVGSSWGNSLGAALSKWLGSGDYAVSSNSIVSRLRASDSIPMMHNDSQTIVVRHKEFLGEIKGSTTFTNQLSLPINPGVAVSFPWLSGIASKFQEYKIRGMVYHYVPSSGNNSGSSVSLGTVIISTSYRSNDSAPGSKIEALNEYTTNECVPCDTFAHPVECNPDENPFNVQYVRTGAVPSGDSQLMYDLGTTFVSTSGQANNTSVLGDLWVTYEIELKKPLYASSATSSDPTYCGQWTSPSSSNWFNVPVGSSGSLGIVASGQQLRFPTGVVGTYLILFCLNGTGITAVAGVANPTLSNCTLASPFFGASANYQYSGIQGSVVWYYMVAVNIPDPTQPATVTIPSFNVTNTTLTSVQTDVIGPMYQ